MAMRKVKSHSFLINSTHAIVNQACFCDSAANNVCKCLKVDCDRHYKCPVLIEVIPNKRLANNSQCRVEQRHGIKTVRSYAIGLTGFLHVNIIATSLLVSHDH
jgi:hypothetical protein